MDDIIIRIAGANGDGIESAARILAKAIGKNGFHVFGFRSYQSIIRGGSVWFQVRVSNKKLYSVGDNVDILVSIDIDGIRNNIEMLDENSVVIYDSKLGDLNKMLNELANGKKIRSFGVPILDNAIKVGGSIYRNTYIIGLIGKIIGLSQDSIHSTINEVFKKKPAVIPNDINAADAGYGTELDLRFKIEASERKGDKYILTGNDAIAIGAAAAGCKFYAAYPMTPASTILEWFAAHENHGVMYKQPEDEITAINMTIGAASAGVRAMCGTSGGGFSLMVEALGLAGMLEVPIVIIESQRGGPSTGLPTKTEQGDLLFVTHASQGDFPRVVIAPRNTEECFYEMSNAFNMAERYQCPVIVLIDMFLSEHIETINVDPSLIKIDRGLLVDKPKEDFKRYEITESGISPRSILGSKGLAFVAPSDEHDEYGNLVSDIAAGTPEGIEMRKRMHAKRMRKLNTMLKDGAIKMPLVINENADIFMVTFGSATNSCIEAAEILKGKGINAGVISFSYMFPMYSEKVKSLLNGKRLVDVECNYSAQLSKLIKMHTGIEIKDTILKYDGEQITSMEISENMYKIANQK